MSFTTKHDQGKLTQSVVVSDAAEFSQLARVAQVEHVQHQQHQLVVERLDAVALAEPPLRAQHAQLAGTSNSAPESRWSSPQEKARAHTLLHTFHSRVSCS